MRIHEILDDTLTWRRDLTLEEEIAQHGDVIFEMANLAPDQTGIKGVIFISTAMASHGPRVKFFVKTGRNQPSFSVAIADDPQVVANSLPAKTVREYAPQVIEWVRINQQALLKFWNEGEEWMHADVNKFIAGLVRI